MRHAHADAAMVAMLLVACGPRVDEGAASGGAGGGSTSVSPESTGSFEPQDLCPLVGWSLQLLRPVSGVAFSWDDLPEVVRSSMSSDGKCAALRSGETEIVVVDLERGEQVAVSTPAYDQLSFPGTPARVGAIYGL